MIPKIKYTFLTILFDNFSSMTELIYLADTSIFTGNATVVETGTNEHGTYIILDRTIFYPQWGGQPCDTGIISNGHGMFLVTMVRINEHGIVYHYGNHHDGNITKWGIVSVSIDAERCVINARIHSAWHLIDIAKRNIGLGSMQPTKWYHFMDGPYVEYLGTLDEPIEWIQEVLQWEIDRLIEQNIPINITYDTAVPSPTGKIPRYVSFEGYEGCGCGGTHVGSSGEIGNVAIRKIKMKDGKMRVGYGVG